MKIRALIVDDERPARKKIRRFLEEEAQIEIVGEAADGLEALDAMNSLRPDLLFLDIQMPKMNGFELLEAWKGKRPQIIFTTAYDQFALKAFEVRALDYLLKPFDQDRFREALHRLLENTNVSDRDRKLDELIQELRSRQRYLQRILFKEEGGRVIFIPVEEIRWIDAEEKYVRLRTAKESYLHRQTMNHLEQQLDPSMFARIHRSRIVNLRFVKELHSWSHGDYVVVMQDGTRFPLGRTYRDKFLK